MQRQYKAQADAYATKKTAFEGLVTPYNTAVTDENERVDGFLGGAFSGATEIPERPCAPTVPAAYSGLVFDGAQTTAFASYVAADKTAKKAVPSANAGIAVGTYTQASGFLQGSTNDAIPDSTTAEIANVGHIFGRFGQGPATTPSASAEAFQWTAPGAAHDLLISILPYDATSVA